jgi:predicted RNA-binding protein with PUA-like domain
MHYWLMKSEPDTYSIDDLKRDWSGHWEGVRNYQARNMIRDDMRKGDQAFFYHSSCKQPGIAGVMTLSSDAYPDFTACDRNSKYYDPKSSADNPRWFMVDVTFQRKFSGVISLAELKQHQQLADLLILRRGNRLSITPVAKKEWGFILELAKHT